jgi:hypothetical protein
MDRRRVRALTARTEFVPGFGMISFDPDSKREDLRLPLVPTDAIESLVGKGWVADDVEPEAEADASVADAPGTAPAAAEKPAKAAKGAKAKAEEAPASNAPTDDAPAA